MRVYFAAGRSGFLSGFKYALSTLPGCRRRIKEEPLTRLKPLVNALADKLELESSVPYALFGHSMGALISFELARELRPGGCFGS